MRNKWNGAFQLLGQLAVAGGVMFGLLWLAYGPPPAGFFRLLAFLGTGFIGVGAVVTLIRAGCLWTYRRLEDWNRERCLRLPLSARDRVLMTMVTPKRSIWYWQEDVMRSCWNPPFPWQRRTGSTR